MAGHIVQGDRFPWTEEIIRQVRDMKIEGLSFVQAAASLNEIYPGSTLTYAAVETAWRRFGGSEKLMVRDNSVKTYTDEIIPDDDYIVSCDYHAPFHSEAWINRLLLIAEKFKIKKHIIIGDLFDMSFASFYRAKDGEKRPSLDEESAACAPLFNAFDYFDQNILINGNHESRIGNLSESKIEARHLFGIFGADVWAKKFRYITADKAFVGDKWLLIHPKSYSQISASVAVRLAEKYHRNILNAHGHFCAMRFDRSGKFLAVDAGGMYDVSKVGYINVTSTTHPSWNNSFSVIRHGKLQIFHKETDWDWWLA
jgi:hypothetical protein